MSAARKPRQQAADGVGRLEAIWVKRVRRGPMDPVARAELVAGRGIDGNANAGGKRQVTLIEGELWDDVRESLDAPGLDPTLRRANLMVRGAALGATLFAEGAGPLLKNGGRVLRVGSCLLRIHGEVRPCRLMEEQHAGLKEALSSERRGGVFGEVIEGGEIAVGDEVAWET